MTVGADGQIDGMDRIANLPDTDLPVLAAEKGFRFRGFGAHVRRRTGKLFVSCRLAGKLVFFNERQCVAEEVDFILRFDPTIRFERQSSSILLITSADKFGRKLAVLRCVLEKIIPAGTERVFRFSGKRDGAPPSADQIRDRPSPAPAHLPWSRS